MRRYFLVAWMLALISPLGAAAQSVKSQAYVDSMIAALPANPADTADVLALLSIAAEYNGVDKAVFDTYVFKGLHLAEKLSWKPGQARAYFLIGNERLTSTRYADALDNLLKAISIYRQLGDERRLGSTYGNISHVYLCIGEKEKAYAYALKALSIRNAHSKMMTTVSFMWGNIDLGSAALAVGKRGQALACYLRADSFAQLQPSSLDRRTAKYYLANYYLEAGDYPRAVANYQLCAEILDSLRSSQYAVWVLSRLGLAYLKMADMPVLPKPDGLIPAGRLAMLDKAAECFSRGVAMSKIGYVPPADLRGLMVSYAEVFSLEGNYRKAADAYRKASELGDSVFKAADGERIARMESEQALALKDKDIRISALELSKQENQSWMLMGGVGLLAVVLGLVYRGLRQQKRSNTLLAKEKRHTEAQKKRSDDLLLNILPEEVAEELKTGGTSPARQFDKVSVLFTDFVNFTEAAERLSPTELVAELHTCFSAFDGIIEKHGLEKIKTIGDAYMAVSGLPITDPAHARKCVAAALDIRDYISERNRVGGPFQIRIGINSGPVVAGIVGIKKFAYDIWGDTVNTAARMEQHGEAGQVNISATTYALIKEDFACTERGKITAKHKGDVEMYFVQTKVSILDGHS